MRRAFSRRRLPVELIVVQPGEGRQRYMTMLEREETRERPGEEWWKKRSGTQNRRIWAMNSSSFAENSCYLFSTFLIFFFLFIFAFSISVAWIIVESLIIRFEIVSLVVFVAFCLVNRFTRGKSCDDSALIYNQKQRQKEKEREK